MMKALTLIAALLAASTAGLALAASPPGTPKPSGPAQAGAMRPDGGGDANRGRFLANGGEMHAMRFTCAQCHGVDGAADASGAFPRLTGQSAWYLYTALHAFAAGTRPSPVMGPVAAELTDADMRDLAAYFASIGKAGYPLGLPPDQSAVAAGRQIATGGVAGAGVPACAACHGDAGEGAAPLYPFIGGQYAPYLEAQLRAFKTGTRHDDPGAVMRSIAARLTDQQIHAVAVYYASLRPAKVVPGQQLAHEQAQPPAPLPMRTGATINPQPHADRTVLPKGNGAAGGQ